MKCWKIICFITFITLTNLALSYEIQVPGGKKEQEVKKINGNYKIINTNTSGAKNLAELMDISSKENEEEEKQKKAEKEYNLKILEELKKTIGIETTFFHYALKQGYICPKAICSSKFRKFISNVNTVEFVEDSSLGIAIDCNKLEESCDIYLLAKPSLFPFDTEELFLLFLEVKYKSKIKNRRLYIYKFLVPSLQSIHTYNEFLKKYKGNTIEVFYNKVEYRSELTANIDLSKSDLFIKNTNWEKTYKSVCNNQKTIHSLNTSSVLFFLIEVVINNNY